MIKTVAINKDFEIIKNIDIEKLMNGDLLWYWIDIDRPNQDEIQLLESPLGFHPLAIEDCTNETQRAKLDYYEGHIFFVTQEINQSSLIREEVNLFLGDNYLVTFHEENSDAIDNVWQRLVESTNVAKWNPILVLYHVLDKIVDNYFPLVENIEDTLSEIDENSNQKSMGLLLDELFEARHHLLSLRHVVSAMRDLTYRILNSQRFSEMQNKDVFFSDIYNHLLKLTEMIEENRELTTDIRDSYISLNSHQTNRVMKVLTVITTIFMPLTFIAGVYGMNFAIMPELKWHYGYFGTLAVMFLIALWMFIWFKRKGWFD